MTDADDEVASKRSVIAKSDDGGGVGVDTGEGYHEDGQVTQVEEDEDGGAGCVRRNRRRKRSIEVGDEGRMRKRSIEMDDDAVITKADEEAEVEEGKRGIRVWLRLRQVGRFVVMRSSQRRGLRSRLELEMSVRERPAVGGASVLRRGSSNLLVGMCSEDALTGLVLYLIDYGLNIF